MTDTEKELVQNYPESAAFAGVAESVWNGNNAPLKIEMAVKNRLHAELRRLLGKDIKTVFLTDSDIRHIKKKHGGNEAARGQVDWKAGYIPRQYNNFPLQRRTQEPSSWVFI